MWEYFETKREEKKKMTREEKAAVKKEKDELEAKYKTCLLDGRKENVGNFRIEPPGLFRGRGKHPKTGKLKVSLPPRSRVLTSRNGCNPNRLLLISATMLKSRFLQRDINGQKFVMIILSLGSQLGMRTSMVRQSTFSSPLDPLSKVNPISPNMKKLANSRFPFPQT